MTAPAKAVDYDHLRVQAAGDLGVMREVLSLFLTHTEQVLTELDAASDPKLARYLKGGVPEDLARRVALLDRLASGADITAVANSTKQPVANLTRLYSEIGGYFRLDTLRQAAEGLQLTDYYDRLAVNSTVSILADAQRAVLEDIVRAPNGPEPSFARWLDRHGKAAERAKASLDEIIDSGAPTLARLTVAAAQLRDLAQG